MASNSPKTIPHAAVNPRLAQKRLGQGYRTVLYTNHKLTSQVDEYCVGPKTAESSFMPYLPCINVGLLKAKYLFFPSSDPVIPRDSSDPNHGTRI